MNFFMPKSKQPETKETKIPSPGLNLNKKDEEKDVDEKKVVEQIAEINILKDQMLNEATAFHQELDQLEHQLIKKSNELEIFTSEQMNEISQKNIALVQQFIKYQESLINKLQGKTSNWDSLETQLHEVELKVSKQMDRDDLPVKLAKIEILEEQIQNLMSEIEELNKESEERKW